MRFMMRFALLSSVTLGVYAQEEAQRAAAMLQKSCDTCHAQVFAGKASEVYVRANRRVASKSNLVDQVKLWNSSANAKWNAQEIELVVGYLNDKFYKFD